MPFSESVTLAQRGADSCPLSYNVRKCVTERIKSGSRGRANATKSRRLPAAAAGVLMSKKHLFLATSALFGSLLAGEAFAQSTASQTIDESSEVQEVVVTGTRGPRSIEGVVRAETAPRARTSISQEYITTQMAGQTIFESLNQTPGLTFFNNDPYGSSGGNIRLRGQDGNRVALTWDGIPLNDTGNYATFTNQLLDPEIVDQVNVNTGTAEVDSPSPAAVGGTINYTTIRPDEEFGGWIQPSVGSWNYRRVIGRIDTGEVGPFGTRAFAAASYQNYDKFRGPGELEKVQGNAYIFQEFRESDFIGLGFHYNENRNNSYRALNLAQFLDSDGGLDNDKRCIRATPVAGTVQNERTQNTVVTSQDQTVTNTSCTNYYELRNNPSNTGNIRAQSRFALTDSLQLTFDPYFQYTLANGGGFSNVAENDGRLRGASTAGGVDLNGDGDIIDGDANLNDTTFDGITLYTPNTTNTRRYGFTSSLVYDLTDQHQVRLAYTVDYGRHRQTGEATYVTPGGDPLDVFGGKDGYGPRVRAADGSFYRGRDRFSIASLQQVAGQYRGRLLDDRLILDLGIRAPFFKRDLNQYCYTQDSISGAAIGGTTAYCTTENALTQANGAVRFASRGTTDFIRPYEAEVEYDAVLPNVGASFEFMDNHRVFASYAEGFAAPRTDSLYAAALVNGQTVLPDVQPETSDNYDLGYRYSGPGLVVYGTIFRNEFQNRIQSSFDPDLGFSVDRNVGAVDFTGADFQIGFDPIEQVTLSFNASYLKAELKDNLPVAPNATPAQIAAAQTAGKRLVETPEYKFGGRVQFRPTENLEFGLEAEFVDSRFTNDLNTEQVDAYSIWDFDARYNLAGLGERFGIEDAWVQFNVKNLFNEQYLSSINSQAGSGLATAQVGSPTTVQLSIRAGF